jgi:TonB family protein
MPRSEAIMQHSFFPAGECRKMREIVAAFSITLAAACAVAQQTPAQAPEPVAAAAAPGDEVHYAGPGVVAPELLPADLPITTPAKCEKLDGKVKVFIAVDAGGMPKQVYLLDAQGNGLDEMALHFAELSKFKPGTVDGAPALVGIADEIKMQVCLAKQRGEDGKDHDYIALRSAPVQQIGLAKRPAPVPVAPPKSPSKDLGPLPSGVYQVGGDVSAPKLLKQADPEFPHDALGKPIEGSCTFKITVDEHGMPRDPVLATSPDPSLDLSAIRAIMRFRFTPGMRHGEPVPVRIEVAVGFKSY